MIARAAGTTKSTLYTSSRRQPLLRGAGVAAEAAEVACGDSVSMLKSDTRLLLSLARGRSARAGFGHRLGRGRLPRQDELHTGVDGLRGVRPLGAELSGAGAGGSDRVHEA